MLAATSGVVPSDIGCDCACATPDVRDRSIELLEVSLNDGEKLPAVRRQFDVTCRAVEQPESDATFQLFDQHAQAGWRDEKRFGSTREIVMLRCETESAQLPGADFHY